MHDKKPSPVGEVPSAHTGADEGRAEGLGAIALESSSHRLTAMPAPFDKGAYWCVTAAPLVKGPIPLIKGKCPEGTKGIGQVPPEGADEGNAEGLRAVASGRI